MDPKFVALAFNERINARDVEGLTALMTEDHTFIDTGDAVTRGRDEMTDVWAKFLEMFPDYRNVFWRVENREDLVIMIGHSECSTEQRLDGPAIWTATIEGDQVAEWRVYDDTWQVRQQLGVEDNTGHLRRS